MLFQFGEWAFRLGLFWRGRTGRGRDGLRNLCGCCREQLESSCAEGAEVGFLHVLRLYWYNIHGGTDVVGCSHHWLTYRMWKLWSLSWVSHWQRPSAAATSRSWWIKAKPLGLSSENDGKLPTCPGTLGIRVTLMRVLYKGWNSHVRKYLTWTLIGVGIAVINPNAENVRIYKSSFLADVGQQIWLSVVISFL